MPASFGLAVLGLPCPVNNLDQQDSKVVVHVSLVRRLSLQTRNSLGTISQLPDLTMNPVSPVANTVNLEVMLLCLKLLTGLEQIRTLRRKQCMDDASQCPPFSSVRHEGGSVESPTRYQQ